MRSSTSRRPGPGRRGSSRSPRRAEKSSWLPPVPRSSGTATGVPTTCASAAMARSVSSTTGTASRSGPRPSSSAARLHLPGHLVPRGPQAYPPPEAAADFVRDYETARGRRFAAAERVVIGAAATYASATRRAASTHRPDRRAGRDSARVALRAYAPEVLAALLADPTEELSPALPSAARDARLAPLQPSSLSSVIGRSRTRLPVAL